jgi:hypothetical protein
MIDGLSFEYAHARVAARLAQRPDERLWAQLRSSRSVPALLEVVRASPAASTVSGVPASGDADAIELAFRQQLRTRIAEVAGWAPLAWHGALAYTRHLLDLPAVLHLLGDELPPRWIAADPALAPYAIASTSQRRAALAAGPIGSLVAAYERDAERRPSSASPARAPRMRAGAALHRLVGAWLVEWQRLWPRTSADERASLEAVIDLVRAHLLRFASLSVEDAAAARHALAARLALAVRRHVARPAALVGYLALVAVDLERLRGEFVLRARRVGGAG